MRVPVLEAGKEETEEGKIEEEENEEDKVCMWESTYVPKNEFVPVMDEEKNVPLFFSLSLSEQVFPKPVIEDLSMELARKCTELISDVSSFGDFCVTLHCRCGTVMS